MKTNIFAIAFAAASVLGLSACSSNPTNAQIGTGVGAVAGGLAGSALGGTGATVIGAGAGALLGNEVGKRTEGR